MTALTEEYLVLCRQWARAQRHAEHGLRLWQQQCQALERDVIRLRGRLLAVRTALLWGLPVALSWTSTATARMVQTLASPQAPEQAARVLCRVGCQGHAHPALDADGSCRWHGGACAAATEVNAQTQSIG
ncbi:hypothetical protein Talka_01407 [Tepidimonas alkaliphilus]|uniref:Uncharacterized protein n=1 Tax=Tepidimonas alkaliphilus TaxID=2588942 RepID=A0A554W7Z2_9BURK|nr:hypothetical protein [Tepidimonas alkaliphilus]TSE19688.1 hypothetical protein Talka_01407 [Tepidimonas alkaliphilus]